MADNSAAAEALDPSRTLLAEAAVAVEEAALRIQELELYETDNLHLALVRRSLDALDAVTDDLDFLRSA